jgi:hypothetical protein
VNPSTPKALKQELSKDNWLLLQFHVAKELGMTLGDLRSRMTPEELLGWSSYFAYVNEEQEKQMEQARRQR